MNPRHAPWKNGLMGVGQVGLQDAGGLEGLTFCEHHHADEDDDEEEAVCQIESRRVMKDRTDEAGFGHSHLCLLPVLRESW